MKYIEYKKIINVIVNKLKKLNNGYTKAIIYLKLYLVALESEDKELSKYLLSNNSMNFDENIIKDLSLIIEEDYQEVKETLEFLKKGIK